jgi:translation initiation factor 1
MMDTFQLRDNKMDNTRLVYSTETGSICKSCQKPVANCACKKKKSRPQRSIKYDGKIRIQRETKGRKGKTVSTVSGFDLDDDELKDLATGLKRKCGTGGSVKDGIIIIQGDHRNTLLAELKKQGYTAILSGG